MRIFVAVGDAVLVAALCAEDGHMLICGATFKGTEIVSLWCCRCRGRAACVDVLHNRRICIGSLLKKHLASADGTVRYLSVHVASACVLCKGVVLRAECAVAFWAFDGQKVVLLAALHFTAPVSPEVFTDAHCEKIFFGKIEKRSNNLKIFEQIEFFLLCKMLFLCPA